MLLDGTLRSSRTSNIASCLNSKLNLRCRAMAPSINGETAAVKVQTGQSLVRPLVLNAILQFNRPIQYRFRSRRTTRDVKMYRNNTVDALQYGIVKEVSERRPGR